MTQETANASLAVSIEEAARILAVGRTSMYALMGSGAITTIRIGKRRVISRRELERFIERQENLAP